MLRLKLDSKFSWTISPNIQTYSKNNKKKPKQVRLSLREASSEKILTRERMKKIECLIEAVSTLRNSTGSPSASLIIENDQPEAAKLTLPF